MSRLPVVQPDNPMHYRLPLDKVVPNATEVVDRRTAVAAATEAELLQADEHRGDPKRDKPLQDGVAAENHYTADGFVFGSL